MAAYRNSCGKRELKTKNQRPSRNKANRSAYGINYGKVASSLKAVIN